MARRENLLDLSEKIHRETEKKFSKLESLGDDVADAIAEDDYDKALSVANEIEEVIEEIEEQEYFDVSPLFEQIKRCMSALEDRDGMSAHESIGRIQDVAEAHNWFL